MAINGNVSKKIEEELEISILLENFNYSNTAIQQVIIMNRKVSAEK